MSTRAPAMPAEDRRAAIVRATLPLLLEGGAAVSTKQIAEAAGIAEGTIFRVFPDKDAVVQAAIELALDPEPTEQALDQIDRSLPFEAQLAEAAAILQRRTAFIWRLFQSVGDMSSKPTTAPPVFPALAKLIEPYRHLLRNDPETAARQLRAFTLALSHPMLINDDPMDPHDIVALLLDGMRKR